MRLIIFSYLLLSCLAATIDVRGPKFPADIYYIEGLNETIPIFRNLAVWSNYTLTVDVSVFLQPANTRTSDVYTNPLYSTGDNFTINSYLSNLSIYMTRYENRALYVELRFYIGQYSENAPIGTIYAGVYLYGTSNNSMPYIDGPLSVDVYLDGGVKTPQALSPSFWNAFTDDHDLYYDISDPGISTATLLCTNLVILVNGVPSVMTSIANAKAGSFSILASGTLIKKPSCHYYVTDQDKNGIRNLDSPLYELNVIFTPHLGYLARFRVWSTSVSGIITWLGTAFGIFSYFSIIRSWNERVNGEVYMMTHRYRVNLWRFARKTLSGKIVGPEPLIGKWLGVKSTYNFLLLCDQQLNRELPYNQSVDVLFTSLVDSGNIMKYTGILKWIMLPFASYYVRPLKYTNVEHQVVLSDLND